MEEYVEIPRIKVGQRQTIETLINEEALLFGKHLRGEQKDWIPRVAFPVELRSKVHDTCDTRYEQPCRP